ncbi:MAG: 50S ribosomal protein L9 [Candidatus Paceibacterota bacterium]
MKIILQQDVEDLGEEGEIKEVSDGFARNYLIPEGMAKRATEEKVEEVKKRREKKEEKKEKELEELQDKVSELDGREIEVEVKVGEEGQLYESVSAGKIQNALKEEGFKVKRKQIELEDTIEELGEFKVDLSFKHNLEAQIRVIVNEK